MPPWKNYWRIGSNCLVRRFPSLAVTAARAKPCKFRAWMNPRFGKNSEHRAMSDYAPLYSKRERIRLALILAAVFLPLLLFAHYCFIPWISAYVPNANCYQYGDHDGLELLIYGVFVAIPLFFALVLLLLLGPRSLRIVRTGQDPLPGEKVLRKTRYRYGIKALLVPLTLLIMLLALVGMSIWGSFQVDKLTSHIVPCSEQLKADGGIDN